jgi:hypothetical protein
MGRLFPKDLAGRRIETVESEITNAGDHFAMAGYQARLADYLVSLFQSK